ncbi:hypothetical protein EDD18DRAFT_1084618 [Armillaria luteobubalina]|uniref:Secreted protein n=1 Tax=Armillaria luteobubalina TaxID=153913 RepID=A0AA39PF13_9AGAR|nr:hypothetical protein EDD18DRAFT_1084618 [Armillaria luteobubalina]
MLNFIVAILLAGRTGRTATHTMHLLLLTSRRGVLHEPFKGSKFDWYDLSTLENISDRVHPVALRPSQTCLPSPSLI